MKRRTYLKSVVAAVATTSILKSTPREIAAQSGGPSDEISGTVLENGTPQQGVTINAVPHDSSLTILETTTDSNGDYLFSDTDLHNGENLYHVIARDGTETNPRRGVQNYPFISATGQPAIPDSGGTHQWNYTAGSGTTVADTDGSLDLNYTGLSWGSGAGLNSTYGDLDGTNDAAEIASSELTHFLSSQQGTVFMWVLVPNNSAINELFTTQNVGSGNNIRLALDLRSGEDHYDTRITIDSNDNAITGLGDAGAQKGNWVALALVADGTDLRFFVAEPSGYDVTQLGSTQISGSSTGNWDHNIGVGKDTGNDFRYHGGGFDITWVDDTGWAESKLQNYVNGTESYYP